MTFATLLAAADVPTGDDPATVHQFYDWLYSFYLSRNPNSINDSSVIFGEPPQWDISWGGPLLQIASVGIVMISVFWVFAHFFNHPRRERSMLYRPASYGGTLTERHGRFGSFNRILYVPVVLWALYYVVDHVLTGQVY